MTEETEAIEEKNPNHMASFSIGSNSKGGNGVYKFYINLDRIRLNEDSTVDVESLKTELKRGIAVMQHLQSKGYATPNIELPKPKK